MADKKISQLAAATTPLTGTEAVPIVQGGSTVKVPVSNLTAGRSVEASQLTTTGNLRVGGTSETSALALDKGVFVQSSANNDAIGFSLFVNEGTNGRRVALWLDDSTGEYGLDATASTGVPVFVLKSSLGEIARVVNDTSLQVTSGDVVVGTAGKGVDFSANAGAAGETSSLLDWYEEGDWTPVLTFATPGDLSVAYSTQVGRYTRIGRQVTVFCAITTSSFTHTTASGALQISGLPFTSANVTGIFFNGSVTATGWTKTCEWIVSSVQANSSAIIFQASTSGGIVASVQAADCASGTTQGWRVAVTYFV